MEIPKVKDPSLFSFVGTPTGMAAAHAIQFKMPKPVEGGEIRLSPIDVSFNDADESPALQLMRTWVEFASKRKQCDVECLVEFDDEHPLAEALKAAGLQLPIFVDMATLRLGCLEPEKDENPNRIIDGGTIAQKMSVSYYTKKEAENVR